MPIAGKLYPPCIPLQNPPRYRIMVKPTYYGWNILSMREFQASLTVALEVRYIGKIEIVYVELNKQKFNSFNYEELGQFLIVEFLCGNPAESYKIK